MTEDEAKTKWCPFARVVGLDGSAGNRHILSAEGMNGADRCIASTCMAWRHPRYALDDEGYQISAPANEGFCGLAGAPQ